MHSSADDGGNRLEAVERLESGVAIADEVLVELSYANSFSLRLPGEVIVGMRAAL
jgi:hypothetical protein